MAVLTGGLLGCGFDLETCDEDAAFELVYSADGLPAFAGQALMLESCGAGGFCHAENIEVANRFGAPTGMFLDVSLASTTTDPQPDQVARLSRAQRFINRNRTRVLSSIMRGSMPPDGLDSDGVLEATAFGYERVGDGGAFVPLPGLDTREGREIVRNWLACDHPVVERTQPATGDFDQVGITVAACQRTCVEPTWEAIHPEIIRPTCAVGVCHGDDEPSAGLDLTAGDGSMTALNALRDRLVGDLPLGAACERSDFSSMPMLTPDDADGSLLYVKSDPSLTRCGSLMPLAGSPLSPQRLCAMRSWIECGACARAEDCRPDCLNIAAVNCGVVVEGGEARCASEPVCPGVLPVGP